MEKCDEWSETIAELFRRENTHQDEAYHQSEKGIQTEYSEEIRLRSVSPGKVLRSMRKSRPSTEQIIEWVRLGRNKGDVDGLMESDGAFPPSLLSYAQHILDCEANPIERNHPGFPLIMRNRLFGGRAEWNGLQTTVDTLVTGSGGYFTKGEKYMKKRSNRMRNPTKRGQIHTRIPQKRYMSPHRLALASPIRSVPIHISVMRGEVEKPGLATLYIGRKSAPRPYPKTSIDCPPTDIFPTYDKSTQVSEMCLGVQPIPEKGGVNIRSTSARRLFRVQSPV